MTFFESRRGLIFAAASCLLTSCSSGTPTHTASVASTGGAGSTSSSSESGNASGGVSGAISQSASGAGATPSATGVGAGTPSGAAGNSGALSAGSGAAATDDAGTGAGDSGAQAENADAGPLAPINVTPGPAFVGNFDGQPMYLNHGKPAVGKLVLLLGGICTGTGAGGFESFIHLYGFHTFAPATQTCVNSAPQMYKTTIQTAPLDPVANAQVGDARLELWDGVDRVNWVTVPPGTAIRDETVAALKYGMTADPGGDWGYFLNADGSLRTTDVWVVGYSWGSQSWAMISSYVQFDRVITTSGPQDEGFPNANWITNPSPATPGDKKYILVGFDSPYPSTAAADSEVMGMFTTVTKAGWPGMPTNVLPNGTGTYTSDQHLFAMVGSNGASPGGHTVFCNDNQMNGWIPLCKYVANVN